MNHNFWQWSGGMSQYVAWATGEPLSDPDDSGDWNGFMQHSARFYALPKAQAVYRDAIRTVIGRTNGISGIAYVDDPTVMSWQLANEPRPGSQDGGRANIAAYDRWIDETAAYIRGLAPRQLVSTGSEGAMGSIGDLDLFLQAHKTPNVDYLTFHLWPSNWSWIDHKDPAARLESGLKTSLEYIDRHIDAAGKLGKPIVLSEFGLNRDGGSFDPTRARSRVTSSIARSTRACCSACRPATPSPAPTSGPGAGAVAPQIPISCGRPAIRSPAIRRRKRRACSRCSTATPRPCKSSPTTPRRCRRCSPERPGGRCGLIRPEAGVPRVELARG